MNLALFIPEIAMVVTAAIVILLDLFVERKRWLAQVSISGLELCGVLGTVHSRKVENKVGLGN